MERKFCPRLSMYSILKIQSYSASDLVNAPSITTSTEPNQKLRGEALMASILDLPTPCAVRIGTYLPIIFADHLVPTRNTDFAHLRDGFTRAIQARQKLARSAKLLTDADEERISQSTQALKALFPSQAVPKGKALTLIRLAKGDLVVEYEVRSSERRS